MRRFLATLTTLAALACPGCSDPEASRLAVGSRAMVLSHNKDAGRVERGERISVTGMIFPLAEDGTMVKVVGDDDDPEHDWKTRDVRIRILDGPLEGRTGTITRWSLRPE